ncbi:hypothetical protein XENOCAPTIV_019498 [Xenoophorus captivus]|uniref:Secreted protein n=1 Tax=Xenoophorus captivus TaxID=1517983 RepID=A0ABV0RAY7_9TELE
MGSKGGPLFTMATETLLLFSRHRFLAYLLFVLYRNLADCQQFIIPFKSPSDCGADEFFDISSLSCSRLRAQLVLQLLLNLSNLVKFCVRDVPLPSLTPRVCVLLLMSQAETSSFHCFVCRKVDLPWLFYGDEPGLASRVLQTDPVPTVFSFRGRNKVRHVGIK